MTSFKEDRLWNTPPDADAPDDVKYRYQKELRRRWEAMGDLPSAILDFPLPDPERWWTHPHGIDPSYQQRQQLRKLRNAR
jgi:hypothetical protein